MNATLVVRLIPKIRKESIMPTGYTAAIEDGKITNGRDFLLQCSRNFGALIHMREDSMSSEIKKREPSDYHEKSLKKAKEDLDYYCKMSDEQIEKEIEVEFKESIESNIRYYENGEKKNRTYEKVLAEVLQWIPPTNDHKNLKEFAIEQIRMSMSEFHIEYKDLIPKKLSVPEWRAAKIESCLGNISYHTKSKKQEEDTCKKVNDWIDSLIESLNE